MLILFRKIIQTGYEVDHAVKAVLIFLLLLSDTVILGNNGFPRLKFSKFPRFITVFGIRLEILGTYEDNEAEGVLFSRSMQQERYPWHHSNPSTCSCFSERRLL